MNSSYILLLRLVLALVIGVIVSRIFFQGMEPQKVLGLAALFFALAYLFEYLRNLGGKGNKK